VEKRFCDLFNLVCDPALQVAWSTVRTKKGHVPRGGRHHPGHVKHYGVEQFLSELRDELKAEYSGHCPRRNGPFPSGVQTPLPRDTRLVGDGEAVRGHGRPALTTSLGCDDPAPSGWTRCRSCRQRLPPDAAVSGFVDLDRHRLIDVVAGRSAKAVSAWLGAKPRWLTGIATAVINPYPGYARGLAEGLPKARLVVDHFHAVRLANQAPDQVRRRVQQATLGHRAARASP
jgi:hypothetical protein